MLAPWATGSGESDLLSERSALPAITFSEPPLVETDWFVPEGGFVAFVLGVDETVYVPDVQFGVVVNWTVTEPPSPASWPPGIRMKPSVTVSEYAVPPALTVAVTPDGLLKHVGTATSVYLRSLPFGSTFDSVTRTRTVAGWLFCRTGFEIGFPDPSTKVIVAE